MWCTVRPFHCFPLRTLLKACRCWNRSVVTLSTAGLNRVIDQAPTFWTGWVDTVMWMQDLRDAMDYHESSGHNPFVETSVKSRDFNSLVRWFESVGDHYGQFQNLECR